MKPLLLIIGMSFLLGSCRTLFFQKQNKAAWQHIEAPHPIGLQAHSACGSSGGKMIAFGGIEAESDPPFNNRLVVYDSQENRWMTSTDGKGPTPRNSASFLVHEGKVHIFGGETPDKAAVADAYSYDIDKAQWEKHSDASVFTSRKQATLSSLGDTIVLFGGKGSQTPKDWGLYDLKSKRWESKPAVAGMEARVSHVAVPVSDSELLIWGGFIDQQRRGDGFILSTHKNSIIAIPPTPFISARANARAIRIDDAVFVWGGATDDDNANSGAIFSLVSRQWEALPPIPDARFSKLKGAELVFVPNKGLLLAGGRFGGDAFNEQLWLFDLKKWQWSPMPTAGSWSGRIAHCITRLEARKLAVFGGIGYAEGTSRLTHFEGLWQLDIP